MLCRYSRGFRGNTVVINSGAKLASSAHAKGKEKEKKEALIITVMIRRQKTNLKTPKNQIDSACPKFLLPNKIE